MDLTKVVDELKDERSMIDRSIRILERLLAGRGGPRGRPPKGQTDCPQQDCALPKGSRKPKADT